MIITKKNCLQIFAASMRVISAMTGNPPLCRLRYSKSDNHVYCGLNNSTFYLILSKSFLNSEIVLVQLLYDVIHQVDYQIGQNRQIQANSDCQGHNGTDINCPVCVQVFILITFKICIIIWYEAGSRGSKQDTVFCYLYTQGFIKLHKRPRRFPLFSF